MTFVTSHVSQTHFKAPDSRCLEKCEIPTVSEFDEIRSGSLISREDSNGEVRFIIRDLEKFRILTEITVLPFFQKLEFFRVLQIDWYTNKGQSNSTVNERNVVSLRFVAQRDSIDSVHKIIFNNQSVAQRNRTVL